jgi:assimilatory nitrate reductase catalytic subunit
VTAGTPTHCPYCALQCAMTITPADGRPAVTPRDFPANRGGLCQKGWTSAELLDTPDRLRTPLLRRPVGDLTEATWDEALGYVTARIGELRRARGDDAVAVFGSGALTNEKAYLLGKFARVALRTSQIDYNGRFCMSSAAAAGNRAFGLDRGLPFPVTDLGRSDLVTKGQLRSAWYGGASNRAALSAATRAATGCGTCGDDLDAVTAWLDKTDPNQKEPALL